MENKTPNNYLKKVTYNQNNGGEMSNLFTKGRLSALITLLSLSTVSAPLMAWDNYNYSCDTNSCCEAPSNNKMYIGGFGGGIWSNRVKTWQMGTAFFTEAEGGPLAVFARGNLNKTSSGFGGFQIGYEMAPSACSEWGIATAGELEVLFHSHKHKGHLFNDTDRLPEHDFFNRFDLRTGVGLVNFVVSIKNSCMWGIVPYLGGGVGVARHSIKNASSTQLAPIEDVNHFNSKTNDSCWSFAAQFKAGARYYFTDALSIFVEYRYLFIDRSDYLFGSTVDPVHVPTSPWNVRIQDASFNAVSAGVRWDF